MRKTFFLSLLPVLFALSGIAEACENHSGPLTHAGSDSLHGSDRFFFDFTFEGLNWETRSAEDGHELHHDGHHVHNKTHEEFYHFGLGARLNEQWTLMADLPYVVRGSTEVDSHATLGKKEASEGLGDAKLNVIGKLWREQDDFLGVLGGVQLPTGSTEERTSQGVLFEPEMQPGLGSTDASIGGVFHLDRHPVDLHGSVVYTFRGEGDHEFEPGDIFSCHVSVERAMNPDAAAGQVTLGVDLSLQIEEKQEHEGLEVEDSGGDTLLLGPSVKFAANDRLTLLASALFPVYQDLGGVHQELDFVWNVSAKVSW